MTPRSKSESKRLAITGKEGQIKKPAIGMDGDSQPARSGGGEAILSQEGPPTPKEGQECLYCSEGPAGHNDKHFHKFVAKQGPPTLRECEADDKAWADIVLQLNFDNYEEAQSIFLIRCAESAIEAVLDLEKEQKEALKPTPKDESTSRGES